VFQTDTIISGEAMSSGDRVLLVENEPMVRAAIRMVLERNGLQVVDAERGVDALESLHQNPVRLVLLDTMIPDMEIGGLLEQIKQCCAAPVVLMTTGSQEQAVERDRRMGVARVLNKPFNVFDFWENISSLL